jgi:hypothetical protein
MSLNLVIAGAMYLAAGAFREIICVTYYKAVTAKKPLSASGLAGGIELWDLIILAAIFRSGFNPLLMLAYTVGVVAGTFVGTKLGK